MLIVQESSQQTVQVHHKQSPTPHYLQLFTMGFKNIPSGLLLAGFLQLLTSMQIFLRVARFTTVPWHSTINNGKPLVLGSIHHPLLQQKPLFL